MYITGMEMKGETKRFVDRAEKVMLTIMENPKLSEDEKREVFDYIMDESRDSGYAYAFTNTVLNISKKVVHYSVKEDKNLIDYIMDLF